ncbi:hypothetical protein J2S43_004847 [Catenuloplanes nepalensis]|uniref:Phage holin family protein n=1 Tax=Catenuloplanes nepalensis TaxID=587533 RepID=A0ABT9MY80_9ACTN|nr:phage holin family protein [Catenuloplanes nepalensis]MDP9796335.1 hypothetical protein [Catenuloplanes nepalensis]
MADVLNRSSAQAGSGRVVTRVGEPSTSELVQRASEQITRLIRDEFALAKAELTEKGKHAGVGVGLFGGGGALALYGLGAGIATIILALALVMPAWLASLIVTIVLFIGAGILALLGRKQVKQAVPPMPQAATDGVKADVEAVTEAVKRGRS